MPCLYLGSTCSSSLVGNRVKTALGNLEQGSEGPPLIHGMLELGDAVQTLCLLLRNPNKGPRFLNQVPTLTLNSQEPQH